MNVIHLVVPTRNRREKLMKMLSSIPEKMIYNKTIDVIIICDGDTNTFKYLENYEYYKRILIPNHIGSVACRNIAINGLNDGVLYATDDIIFKNGSIESAFEMFNRIFVDDDGVVGFVQDLPFHPTGIALVGKKFRDRYPNGILFRPTLWHFAAGEIYEHAIKLGKFIQCIDAKVIHTHPNFINDEIDETHKDARIFKNRDMEILSEKAKNGLIWGYNDLEI